MSGEPLITATGNLTADPELKVTPQGKVLARFTVAVTPRVKVQDSWENGETLWFRCTQWGTSAENSVETFRKGDKVIFSGRLSQKSWKTKTSEERTDLVVELDAIGFVPKHQKISKDEPW